MHTTDYNIIKRTQFWKYCMILYPKSQICLHISRRVMYLNLYLEIIYRRPIQKIYLLVNEVKDFMSLYIFIFILALQNSCKFSQSQLTYVVNFYQSQ